jgi:hypothetical protein
MQDTEVDTTAFGSSNPFQGSSTGPHNDPPPYESVVMHDGGVGYFFHLAQHRRWRLNCSWSQQHNPCVTLYGCRGIALLGATADFLPGAGCVS